MSNYIKDFVDKMLPYATTASTQTHIPVGVILAQWAHESDFGRSSLAKRANNFAGISKWSSVKDGISGGYASFNSLNSFVRGYIHIMDLSYYKGVRDAGSTADTIKALDKSPYATDSKYGAGVTTRYKQIAPYLGDDVKAVSGLDTSALLEKFKNLDEKTKNRVIAIGVGALILAGILK